MKYPEYFHQSRLILMYFHCEDGLNVGNIHKLWWDTENNRSLVIAARGDELRKVADFFTHECQSNQDISESENYRECLELLSDNAFAQKFPERYSEIKEYCEYAEYPAVRVLLVLAFDDGTFDESFETLKNEHFLVNHRLGGAELAIEFMLSGYARDGDRAGREPYWVRDDGVLSDDLPSEDQPFASAWESERTAEFHRAWRYDYSIDYHLWDLEDTFVVYGLDWDAEDKRRFIYGIDSDKLRKLIDMISVPSKIVELLTSEQRRKLPQVVASILSEELDYIGTKLFGLPLRDARADSAQAYVQAAAKSWDEEFEDMSRG